MKKFFGKASVFLLVVVVLVTALSLFVACDPKRPLHIWSEEWTHNAKYHWHACTDEGCPGKDPDSYAEHDFSLIETIKDPSCSEVGRGKYKCDTCGYEKEDDIAKLPHTWVLEKENTPPTCYQQGRGTFKCSVCGEHENQNIEPTGKHNFVEYAHNESGHWKTCSTEGCPATTEPEPHDSDLIERESPYNEWCDGAVNHKCTICKRIVYSDVIPSLKAPSSFDLVFEDLSDRISYSPRAEEDGIPAFDITFEVGKEYLIHIENALNVNGEGIDITDNDLPWDIPNLHGLKAYYINDRNAEVEINLYGGKNPTYTGKTISFSSTGIFKTVFRFETGVNDPNYHNRRIRVSKIFYFHVLPKGTAASASQNSADDNAPYDLGEYGGEDLFFDSKNRYDLKNGDKL